MSVSSMWRGGLTAVIAVALVAGSAACGSSTKGGSGDTTTTTTAQGAPTPAELLGTPHKAAGTPVKVGLLTTGGNCSGCTSQQEEPAARAAVAWINDYENG